MVEMSQAGGYHYIMETAEILSINPLYPPILGDFKIWGAPPDPWQEVSCTSFSAVSIKCYFIKPILEEMSDDPH
jgi:hypothetical protein